MGCLDKLFTDDWENPMGNRCNLLDSGDQKVITKRTDLR